MPVSISYTDSLRSHSLCLQDATPFKQEAQSFHQIAAINRKELFEDPGDGLEVVFSSG